MTLNEVIKRLERIAQAHRQVSDFFYGNIIDYLDNKKDNYPAIVVDNSTGVLDITGKKTTMSFKIYFVSLVNVSEDTKNNEQEVISNMLSVCEDYVALLADDAYDDWWVDSQGSLTTHREEFNDMVAGVSIEIGIGVAYLRDRCQVPASGLPIPTDNDMRIVHNYTYAADGSEGNTITVGLLANRSILMVVREHMVIDAATTPQPDEYNYNASGLFTFGSNLENGEVIQILWRNL